MQRKLTKKIIDKNIKGFKVIGVITQALAAFLFLASIFMWQLIGVGLFFFTWGLLSFTRLQRHYLEQSLKVWKIK